MKKILLSLFLFVLSFEGVSFATDVFMSVPSGYSNFYASDHRGSWFNTAFFVNDEVYSRTLYPQSGGIDVSQSQEVFSSSKNQNLFFRLSTGSEDFKYTNNFIAKDTMSMGNFKEDFYYVPYVFKAGFLNYPYIKTSGEYFYNSENAQIIRNWVNSTVAWNDAFFSGIYKVNNTCSHPPPWWCPPIGAIGSHGMMVYFYSRWFEGQPILSAYVLMIIYLKSFETEPSSCEVNVNVSPSAVWPVLPPSQRPPGYDVDTDTKSYVSVSWSKTTPPEGCTVNLTVEPVDYSGDHSHGGSRPKGNLSMPSITIGVGGVTAGSQPAGTYKSSEISGEEKIVAKVNGEKKGEATVTVRVPELVDFGSIGSNYWRLTGNSGTTSYKKCKGEQIHHPNNHYASELLYENLQTALFDFFDWSGTDEGGSRYLKLGINDMSLPKGGLFDICGDWGQGHTYHRIGASVDINTSAELFDKPGSYSQLTGKQIRELTKIMKRNNGGRYPEEPLHYGFGGQ